MSVSFDHNIEQVGINRIYAAFRVPLTDPERNLWNS
jgi:hypothetical protein